MVKKGIFQNISFIKINWIIIIGFLFFPNLVKADTLEDFNTIEYIKGTGTQYIDTGFLATGGMKAEYEVEYDTNILNPNINGGYIVGSHNTRSPYARNGGYYNNSNQVKGWELGYGSFYPNSRATINYNQKYKVEFQTISGNGYLKVDDVTLLTDTRSTTMTPDSDVMIFTNAISLISNIITKAKVYYVKIWDKDGNLVRDFIPVKRKSDDIIGMYDKVNDKFYRNVGNDNFEGGPIITNPTPPEPEPTGNAVLDNFLTIYVDRINYLSEKTIENQYMLAFIGIIFGFIVLEMTLHIIHIRGGYKK